MYLCDHFWLGHCQFDRDGHRIIITRKRFDLSTSNVDERQSIKEANMAMAVVLAPVILSLSMVVAAAVYP